MRAWGARERGQCGNIVIAVSMSVLGTDCPECGSEIVVNLQASHRPFSDNEKMVYRVVCDNCGFAFDAHFEDLVLREVE